MLWRASYGYSWDGRWTWRAGLLAPVFAGNIEQTAILSLKRWRCTAGRPGGSRVVAMRKGTDVIGIPRLLAM